MLSTDNRVYLAYGEVEYTQNIVYVDGKTITTPKTVKLLPSTKLICVEEKQTI